MDRNPGWPALPPFRDRSVREGALEERRVMGKLLLHDPWVHFYLFWVGGLIIALIWDSLRYRAAQHPPGLVYRPRRRVPKLDIRPCSNAGRELLNFPEMEASCSARYSARITSAIKQIRTDLDDLSMSSPTAALRPQDRSIAFDRGQRARRLTITSKVVSAQIVSSIA
jgi:hypothetical protein